MQMPEKSLKTFKTNHFFKVHNHFEFHMHLSNKKALFYNLKKYYLDEKKDPFEYIPLTFHIKTGLEDS